MSSSTEVAIPASDPAFDGVLITFIPLKESDGPCASVMLPARATPYTLGEALLHADLSPNLFEAIGNSAVSFSAARDLHSLCASDEVASGDGICIDRRPIAPALSDEVASGDGICIDRQPISPDLSDILGSNTTHSGIAIREPKHGSISGTNTTCYEVRANSDRKKRRFFKARVNTG